MKLQALKMEQNSQLRQYVHLPEDEDIGPPGRTYRAYEMVTEYEGRKVLYVIAETSGVTFCDRSYTSRIETVHVKGYITRWKYMINEKGDAISEMEPIEDNETQQKVKEIIKRSSYIKA